MLLKGLLVFPLLAMIAFGLLLPSDGNHGVMSPKSLSFLAAGGSWVIFVIMQRKFSGRELRLLATCLAIVSLLLIWMGIGAIYKETPFASFFDQFKLFIITLSVVSMVLYYVEAGVLRPETVFKCAIYTNFFYSSLKVLGATLHVAKIVNILTFMSKIKIRFMSMDIHAGMIRLQTSVDIVTPFLLLFVLNSDRLGIRFPRGFRYAYVVIALVSVLLSFSRYLIAVSWISLFLYWVTTRPLKQLLAGVAAAMFLCLGVLVAGPSNVYKVVEKRLFSVDNYQSDQTRVDQVDAMSKEIACHPFFGKGLGGFAPDCVRDNHLLHSYEVQWVAFNMQLGFVGVALVLGSFLALGWYYWFPPYYLPKIAFAAMYALWLVSGFTNPFLISLTSGIMYSLFALAGRVLTEENKAAKLSIR
ncbi:MAG: O-antigen ligase family protein [Parachlamydiales bacterium]|jgi:hypothetical protein